MRQKGLANRSQAIFHIVQVVSRQVICLYKNNEHHVYTDLKPANILYVQGSDDNSITIHLGDIGSVVCDSFSEYVSTYPPPEHPSGFYQLPTADHRVSAIAYQLGVLLISLSAHGKMTSLEYAEGFDNNDTKTLYTESEARKKELRILARLNYYSDAKDIVAIRNLVNTLTTMNGKGDINVISELFRVVWEKIIAENEQDDKTQHIRNTTRRRKNHTNIGAAKKPRVPKYSLIV